MYYSAGNYEAFAPPKSRRVWTANLPTSSAPAWRRCLRRALSRPRCPDEGRARPRSRKGRIAGGACDGYHYENLGYVMRGGREMDNHFE